MLAIAIVMIVAVIFATRVFVAQNAKLIMLIILSALTVITSVIFVIKRHKTVLIIASCLAFAVLPFANIYAKGEKVSKYNEMSGKIVSISGTVSGSYYSSYYNIVIPLKNVKIKYFSDNIKVSGGVNLYVNPNNFDINEIFASGNVIECDAKLDVMSLQSERLLRSIRFLSSNVTMLAYAEEYSINVMDKKPALNDKFTNLISKIYDKDVNYPELSRALIFGDTTAIDASLNDEFRETGIAHILSVSGLHVSLIVLALSFILKKCKVSNKASLIISTILLVVYCYLCQFAISVIRASIMAIILSYAVMRGKAYDKLSALSLALILILLVNPIGLFNISLVLSFIAVFSIFCLMPPLERVLSRVFYPKFAASLALALSAQIGIAAVSLYYFNKVSTISLLANLIVVPIASTAFIILIVSSLVYMIIPLGSVIFFAYNNLINITVNLNAAFANISYPLMGFSSAWIVAISVVSLFIISDYTFISVKKKSVVAVLFIAMLLSFTIF